MTLTAKQKERIVKLHSDGVKAEAIAERFGCGVSAVRNLVKLHKEGKPLTDPNTGRGRSNKYPEQYAQIMALKPGQSFIWHAPQSKVSGVTTRKSLQLGWSLASEKIDENTTRVWRYQ